jgi:bisphosphoglycerate-independent phosphoglycerate mutase (AlkP superfamily)
LGDVLPTILQAVQVPVPQEVHGESLFGVPIPIIMERTCF